MKKSFFLFILIALTALYYNVFAQSTSPSFKVDIKGDGKQALILIPGFACSGDVWEETVQHYQHNYKCYILTMAGFAGTPAQTSPDLQKWVADIAAYIRQNKIDTPVIMGHSMGGGMALILAATHPELISKIVVVDALPCLMTMYNPAFKAQEHLDCSAMINSMTQMNDAQFYQIQKMVIPQLLADTAHLEQVVQWGVKSDRKTFADMRCQYGNTDMRNTITTIKCPALILLEPSFASVKPAVEAQFKNLLTANMQYATKGLHFIMYDDKEWYFQQTDNFLK
ncbi:pimeloyl-ACP methyl ester carboxylesterase [Chitinophaga niastensis]|uniref:Pimeloyl-ACP methyl ester carboxylesterase n=1 Tax=Chitinophaga niastensis TaxID=536980 RepID=A0A2P8HHD4_CHINA|nr:alpha/beta hydrolase [Chitinophaga niastensis]PSL45638.1 pimeloyl-ACP methyl ester carboxylesterase [Chitinophaga niastensis]